MTRHVDDDPCDNNGWSFQPLAKAVYRKGDTITLTWTAGTTDSATLSLERYDTLGSVDSWEIPTGTTSMTFQVEEVLIDASFSIHYNVLLFLHQVNARYPKPHHTHSLSEYGILERLLLSNGI